MHCTLYLLFRRDTNSAKSYARSSSADSSKKKISCNVANLNCTGPNLQIIGTKTYITKQGNGNASSRSSTPEHQPVIKKTLQNIKTFKSKQTRTKEIIQEIQRQLKPNDDITSSATNR